MANAIQHYEVGQDFQLSTNSQLSSFSSNQYSWTGRTLTSWIDDEGVYHLPAAIVNFNRNKVDLSANWELNKYNVSVDFKSAHGKVVATTYCDELPLFSPVNNSIELTKNGQTSSNILYNSLLSIDVVPENENHTTTRFEVNGISQPLSEQYVYRNIATDDKTGDNGFIIIVDFVDEVQPEEPETPIDLTEPLCFTAEEPNAKLYFNDNYADYTNQIQFSYDKQNWSSYKFGSEILLENIGDKVYFKAADGVSNQKFYGYKFDINSGKIAASGNLNTLLKADGSVTNLSESRSCYEYMFEACTALTKAPELPATELALNCYYNMFSGCIKLTQAPELSATTLAIGCYDGMFNRCITLTRAPELPATILADYCYEGMFRGCTSLTQAPALPAKTLTDYCYHEMFRDCTSLNNISVNLSAWNPINTSTLSPNATKNWVADVSSSGTFICPEKLPQTFGSDRIPTGWTVITN